MTSALFTSFQSSFT